ncbi:unnamed protein product [Agarophyton chilense]
MDGLLHLSRSIQGLCNIESGGVNISHFPLWKKEVLEWNKLVADVDSGDVVGLENICSFLTPSILRPVNVLTVLSDDQIKEMEA